MRSLLEPWRLLKIPRLESPKMLTPSRATTAQVGTLQNPVIRTGRIRSGLPGLGRDPANPERPGLYFGGFKIDDEDVALVFEKLPSPT